MTLKALLTRHFRLQLLSYAKQNNFALPAVNVTSSSTAIATLEAAREAKSPIILQTSNGGAAFFAGKAISNTNQEASIAGAIGKGNNIPGLLLVFRVVVVRSTDLATPLSSSCRALYSLCCASLRCPSHSTLRPLCQEAAPLARWHARCRWYVLATCYPKRDRQLT